ncbi:MAG TPA: hypothetical protein VGF04_01725 [Solirubrobacterales bacterium]
MSPPDDANDLRGYYFGLLIRRPPTQVLVGLTAVAAGLAGTLIAGPGVGAAAFLAGLLVALLVVLGIAGSRAEDAFFDFYAAKRGMTALGRSRLPKATPLLRRGDERYAEHLVEGPLGDGVEGLVALYTYEEESSDGRGNRQTSYHRYTVGLTEVPECAERLPELYCQHRSGPRALEGLEDAFRTKKERVSLESEALDERYEIFTIRGQDDNWLRQLFSPGFIVWLTESAPQRFGFELVDGNLCCYVSGHDKTTAELDAMRAASTAVATRLSEEALE